MSGIIWLTDMIFFCSYFLLSSCISYQDKSGQLIWSFENGPLIIYSVKIDSGVLFFLRIFSFIKILNF